VTDLIKQTTALTEGAERLETAIGDVAEARNSGNGVPDLTVIDSLSEAAILMLRALHMAKDEPKPAVVDAAHLERQRAFSERTFGPGPRTHGVLDHIRKELAEIEAAPTDLGEWVDVAILALDGAWRAGHQPQAIIDAIVAKQTRNEARTWPDWRTAEPGTAIEHDRTADSFHDAVCTGPGVPAGFTCSHPSHTTETQPEE
jgi:hypothetical protein